MNESVPRWNDPAALADELRSLANDAYRSLSGQGSARDLSQRASLLRARIDSLAADELSLWLDNAQQRIDSPGTSTTPGRQQATGGSDNPTSGAKHS